MAKKLSTKEILAAARAEKAKSADGSAECATPEDTSPESAASDAGAPESAASSDAAESAPAPSAPRAAAAKKSGGAPKSTQDILAAARAQKASGVAGADKPAAESSAAPAAKPGGGPKSTKDILAAARAQKAGGASATPAADKPAAAKPVKAGPVGKAAAKPAVAASGERPSVQDMLKAVREGKKEPAEEQVSAPPALRKPKKPAAPSKPAPMAAAKEAVGRRNVLLSLVATPFAAAWTMFSVASLAGLLGCARFMMPNIVNEPPSRFKVGNPGDYAPGTVSTKYTAQYGVWVVNAEYQGEQLLYALISICTHLGCTPNWLEGEQKFKCPCHGSGFYMTGINFEGPAPRPLERAGIRIAPDGLLEVDKSVKFQQELGQWDDAASKVGVA